jgi:O-antigen/teichoic acid export membrane protein
MLKKIDNNFLITIFTVIIPISMQFFYIRYVSYNIDKVDYGNFILLQTLVSGLSYIFIQIPSQAYDRFFNTTEDKVMFVNEFRTILIFINFFSLLTIGLYGYIMEKFSIQILVVIFIYFVLLNNYSFNQKVFLLSLERKKYFYLKVLESTAKFLMPLVVYYFYQTLLSFVIGLTIGYLISFLILIQYMKEYKFNITIKLKNIKKYFLFAYPIFFVSLFTWGISFSDRYFIEFITNTKDVAIYSLLAQVAGIGQVVGQVYFMYINPQVLKMYEENKNTTLVYLSSTLKILAFIFTLLAVVAYFLPIQVYEILLEPKIISQDYYFLTLIILVIGIFLTVFQTAYSMYLNLFKRLDVLAYIYLIAFIFNILGNLFIKDYGIIAAAISTLVAYSVILIAQVLYVWKIMPLQRVTNV